MPVLAFAHAFGSRYDLPLPLEYYLIAAGIAVATSVVIAFFAFSPARQSKPIADLPIPTSVWRLLAVSGAVIGIATLVFLLAAAWFGPSSPTKNFATIFIWVWWWVGFFLLSATLINLWPLVNPVQSMAQILFRNRSQRRNLPTYFVWSAPIGLIFLSWLELVSDKSENPMALFWLLIGYIIGSLLGFLRYGSVWFTTCDPLVKLYDLIGAAAVFAIDPESRRFQIRVPAFGLIKNTVSHTASEFFVMILVAVVMFDGLSETPFWWEVLDFVTHSQFLRPFLLDIRGWGVDILKLIETIGLMTLIATAWGCYRLLITLIFFITKPVHSLETIAHTFASSVLPIAIAYHLAHYVSYLMLAGQYLISAATDPLGLGWDLFQTSTHRLDLSVINAEDVWWVAISAVICGHILAVLVGHQQALRFFGNRRDAIISQIPMAAFMIGLTMCSLWILAQPIIQ